MERPPIALTSTVLGAPDPDGLASFYERLLGWERTQDEPDWVVIHSPASGDRLSFQLEEDHVPPVWPAGPDDQQMQLHIDIGVADLRVGVAWAHECGARSARRQPQPDVHVLLDPAGHPFCLFAWAALAE